MRPTLTSNKLQENDDLGRKMRDQVRDGSIGDQIQWEKKGVGSNACREWSASAYGGFGTGSVAADFGFRIGSEERVTGGLPLPGRCVHVDSHLGLRAGRVTSLTGHVCTLNPGTVDFILISPVDTFDI